MLVIWKSLKFVSGKLKAIVKILRKGENCGKEHFLLFSMFELLPNDKISDKSKLEEIADDGLNVVQRIIPVLRA